MNPMNAIKHAPRWAWFAGAGVGIGVIGIRLYRDRGASADTSQSATTVGGTPTGGVASSPTPVIVPPVITNTGGNGEVDTAGILTAVGGVFAPVIDNLAGLVGTTVDANTTNLATYGAGLTALSGQALTFASGNNDAWLSMLASGGLAPAPASQQPPVVNVNLPAPAAVAAGTATSSPNAGKSCPASYPHWNPANGAPGPKSCYQDAAHDECHGGQKSREHAHVYQDGTRQTTGWDVIGGKC